MIVVGIKIKEMQDVMVLDMPNYPTPKDCKTESNDFIGTVENVRNKIVSKQNCNYLEVAEDTMNMMIIMAKDMGLSYLLSNLNKDEDDWKQDILTIFKKSKDRQYHTFLELQKIDVFEMNVKYEIQIALLKKTKKVLNFLKLIVK